MSERAWNVAEVVIVLSVLAVALYGIIASANALRPDVTSVGAGPDPSLIASTVRSPSPSPTPTVAPAPAATPSAAPTRRPVALRAYAFGGRAYTGVELGAGWVVTAPFDAQMELHQYALVGNEIRELPGAADTFPYVILTATDGRRLTFRAGKVGTDTALLARPGPVKAGDELFRVVGSGASSWHDFYDASVPFQIVVSLVSAGGTDLDASSLVMAK